MSMHVRGSVPLNYHSVAYPGSVLRFRGPEQRLTVPFVLCLGGSETYGRFIHAPFASQLDESMDRHVVNMGVMNAGLDVLMRDKAITAATDQASAIIFQITGTHNMSNRFYTVHPRRNDRFLKASTMLKTIYPDVDFTEFHFTRHLLTHLKSVSRDRFALVRTELQTAWAARMVRFIRHCDAPVHLLWISNRCPSEGDEDSIGLGRDPLFVSETLLDQVSAHAASLTIAMPDPDAKRPPTQGMFFAAREEAAARLLPGPAAHDKAAKALRAALRQD